MYILFNKHKKKEQEHNKKKQQAQYCRDFCAERRRVAELSGTEMEDYTILYSIPYTLYYILYYTIYTIYTICYIL